ncbi:MAG: hypothetical protein HXX81_00410 [Campylobacterales bacterium]|nr:hypothetical protein [Campylobacterales bacterium]
MKKVLVLLLFTSSIFAKNINYNEAVEIALKNNIDFKLKQLEVEQKKEILNEATSLDFGKLFLENSSY